MDNATSSWTSLSFRLQRVELLFLGAAAALYLALAVTAVWRLNVERTANPHCFGQRGGDGIDCSAVLANTIPWDHLAEVLLWAALGLPIAFGLVLGVPLVAREVEHQTAQLAWSLSPSRTRWLLARTMPIIAVLVLTLATVGVAAEALAQARAAGEDPGFVRYDQRGVFVPLRGLMAFASAMLLGIWFGRTLPALLAALTLVVALLIGLTVGLDTWLARDAVAIPLISEPPDMRLVGARLYDEVSIMPDGTVSSERVDGSLIMGDGAAGVMGLPAARYWDWTVREIGASIVIIAAIWLLVMRAVRRRRPL